MPYYAYESTTPCKICGGLFEVHQSIHDPPLTHCPTCQHPCNKTISSFAVSKGKMGFDLGKAKDSGMTVLKRRDKGVYEKL